MERPRFSLRTFFVLIALMGIPIGWLASQLNWLRQRNKFVLDHSHGTMLLAAELRRNTPWSLRLLGEPNQAHSVGYLVEESQIRNGQRLFPEAVFYEYQAELKDAPKEILWGRMAP
jgi:hypothetical protein